MPHPDQAIDELLAEKAELRNRLDEVDETLSAIRSGEVDALVVNGSDGPQVYILQAADAESNRFRSDILARINDAVVAVDENEHLIYLNAAAEEHYGVTASDVLGHPLERVFKNHWCRPEDAEASRQELATSGHWRGESVHLKRSGQAIHVESSVSRLTAKDGSPAGLLSVVRDVTERHLAESALRESEERFRTLFNSIDEGFCVVEMIYDADDRPVDYRFLQVSPSFEKHTGLREAIGRTVREFIPQLEDYWFETYHRVAASGEPTRFEHEAASLGRWFDVYAVRFGEAEKRQVAVLFTDITARKEAEDAQRRNQALFSDIIDQAPGGVLVADAELRTLQVNATAMPMFASVKPLIGRELSAVMGILWGTEVGNRLVEILRHTLETGEHYSSSGFTEWRADLGLRQSFDWEARRLVLPSGGRGVVCYFTDTTEKSRAAEALRASEQALAAQAEALRQADRSKDEFLAMLAHELRNPLAPLRNSVAILQASGSSPPQRERAEQLIVRQIENMGRMIDDLLDVSRITEGKIELKREPVTLNSILEAAAESARPVCQDNAQELSVRLPAERLMVDGDPTRLEQIVGNLLGNACKYSGSGSHITLSAELTNDEGPPAALIRVTDDGTGIDPELLPRIFELFVQSSRTLDRAHGGLGIGLTIVHRLVKLHGGSIEAHSDGKGHGAEFRVRLPLASADAGVAPPERPESSAARSFRMLIVDDNRDSADTMAIFQELCGHQTRTAYSGHEAVMAAGEFLPEVVLLDIGLPGMDGYEVARQLRALPGVGDAFLIALTGYGGDDDVSRATAAGFDRHLVKPANLEMLREWLEDRR